VIFEKLNIKTNGELEFIEITGLINDIIRKYNVKNGLCNIFLKSTTSGFIINENDENLIEDFKDMIKKIVPDNIKYRHDMTWGDGNGRSHIRSMFLKKSLCIPIINGKLDLGTWQSIFLVELDVRPRNREISITVTNA
jgi:secondary thiamine-phosphate synthase enzyme